MPPNDESEPLVGSTAEGGRRRGRRRDGGDGGDGGGGVRAVADWASRHCNRAVLFGLLVALASLSLYFNRRMASVSEELHGEETRVKKLEVLVREQADVIERFSDSITNSDVLERVDALENRLTVAERTMGDKLNATEKRVENLLNATLTTLDNIVNTAQEEIHQEVARVKTDVDTYVRATQDQFSMENSFMIYQLAGTFTLIASLISMWHMTGHLRKFRQPFVQRKILAILWMSPLYGITSWLSLVFPQSEGYLAVIKDFYEAYVIYQFLSFCISVLGRGDRAQVIDALVRHADHLEPPFRPLGACFPRKYESDRAMAEAVLMQCQTFTIQFVFCRPLTTIGTFVCNKVGYYGRGESGTDYRSPQFWFMMIQNVSVFVAFSGLLKFYHAVHDELAWCRPFPKFLCIKGIVFMTFWQGLTIEILAKTTEGSRGAGPEGDEESDLWAKQAQNFLICLEMLLFSIAHFYCFPTEEWEEGYRPRQLETKFGDNIALRDFFSDLKMVLRQGSKKKKKGQSSNKLPKTEPDGDEEEGGADGEGEDLTLATSDDGTADSGSVKPEMRMAAARLLASINFEEFDSHEFLSQIEEEERGEKEGGGGEGDGKLVDQGYGAMTQTEEDGAYVGDGGLGGGLDTETPPGETTSLLCSEEESLTTKNEHLLRPSIFTTLGPKPDPDKSE